MKMLLILAALIVGWYVLYGQPDGSPGQPSRIVRSTAAPKVATATPPPVNLGRINCDPAYPETRTCIPPGPPFNQGCAITSERNFRVLAPDPQGLDHDVDGIGCEPIASNPRPAVAAPALPPPAAPAPSGECDPSYPDVCIPPVWVSGDLDCRDVPYGNFRVIGGDPHRLDGPYDGSNPYEPDGLGCEWN